jgi:hypothetical protein
MNFREILLQNSKADWLFLRFAGLRGLSEASGNPVKVEIDVAVMLLHGHKNSVSAAEP